MASVFAVNGIDLCVTMRSYAKSDALQARRRDVPGSRTGWAAGQVTRHAPRPLHRLRGGADRSAEDPTKTPSWRPSTCLRRESVTIYVPSHCAVMARSSQLVATSYTMRFSSQKSWAGELRPSAGFPLSPTHDEEQSQDNCVALLPRPRSLPSREGRRRGGAEESASRVRRLLRAHDAARRRSTIPAAQLTLGH